MIAFGAAVLIVVTVNTVSTPLCLDSAQVGLPPPQGQELRDGKCVKQSSAYRAFFAVLAGVAAAAASLAALLALAVTVTGRGWRRCLICLGIAVVLSIPLFTLKLKAIDYGPVIQGFQPTAPVQ